MFVGRKRELDKLNTLYAGDSFEFAVVYGRRRVGKTTLIREFLKDKESVYYMAVEGTKKENLRGLSAAFLMQGKNNAPAAESYVEFRDYEAALAYIDLLAGEHRRIVIAIDEYPYLAASYPTISSLASETYR